VKRLFAVALGILTAIGGFVDIGDLVTNALVGSRFGMSLAWVVVVGVVGICVFSEMSGRVAAVSGRATFDLVRERLGPRMGLANLVASMAVTFLTFIAEIGGVSLALELATSVNELLWGARRRRLAVDRALAGALLGARERLRAGRALTRGLRGRPVEARPGLGRTVAAGDLAHPDRW
jgi:hypothetical protein